MTAPNDLNDLSDRLIERFRLAPGTAIVPVMDGMRLIHCDAGIARSPCVYESGIFLIIRGRKVGFLGSREFEFNHRNYLSLGLPLALECETFASSREPLFAIYVAVDAGTVREIASSMNLDVRPPPEADVAIRATPYCDAMLDAVRRLMQALCSDEDTRVLGPLLAREIIYRALQGSGADALRGLLAIDSSTSRIAEVMAAIHTRYAERLSVDDLAGMVGMSPSVFHRAFREVTDDTPLQYLKKVRLTNASSLIARDAYRVSSAASAVGYESAAHFSRDFKSHFGIPPADARKLGYAFIRAEMT